MIEHDTSTTNLSHIAFSINRPVRVVDVANELNLSESEVVEQVKLLLESYYKHFGIKAFLFEYISGQGYVIRASSNVGLLKFKDLIFIIDPKVKGLSLSKVMGMAQLVEKNRFKILDSKIAIQIESDIDHSLIDILGFSYLDALQTVLRNGLHRKFIEESERSYRSGSDVNIELIIEAGMVPPPVMDHIVISYDTHPNRLLKFSLEYLYENSKNLKLQILAKNIIREFEGVSKIDEGQISEAESNFFYGVPRSDYERAIALGLSLFNGGHFNFDGNLNASSPSCIVDLDVVFEEFCSEQIQKLFSEKLYEVSLQKSFGHKANPQIDGSIVPDIVVKNKLTNKIVVIDVKNKYSQIDTSDQVSASNQDLYQIYYYGKVLDAVGVILLYPSASPLWKFPLKGSEGESKYNERVLKAIEDSKFPLVKIMDKGQDIDLYKLQVDLSKSVKNTLDSLASIASFIDFLCKDDGEI